MNIRVLWTERQIFDGNACIGYVDDNGDVLVYVNGHATKIGNADHAREVYGIVSEWHRNR